VQAYIRQAAPLHEHPQKECATFSTPSRQCCSVVDSMLRLVIHAEQAEGGPPPALPLPDAVSAAAGVACAAACAGGPASADSAALATTLECLLGATEECVEIAMEVGCGRFTGSLSGGMAEGRGRPCRSYC